MLNGFFKIPKIVSKIYIAVGKTLKKSIEKHKIYHSWQHRIRPMASFVITPTLAFLKKRYL